ncbi:MAG: class I SAM-dependent methyltransferase, partial [Chloroflexi bacterium]|nr:class I SAM-dependent methyltransferase [Chloroflexota bacterium]
MSGSGAALRRPKGQALSSAQHDNPLEATFWKAFYRVFKLPFILAARRLEAKRKRLYPGGHIYSNSRVVRSHFRRSWENAPMEPDAIPSAIAFSRIARSYDEAVVSSASNAHMRALVRDALGRLVSTNARVLDMGCGTGVDVLWLASLGARVLAIDVAEGMVAETARKARDARVDDRIEVRRMAAQDLRSLLPGEARQFDLVLANFGVLNLSGEPEEWGPVIARLLKPGGHLVATVMNRVSAWELVAGLLRLRPSFALRRLRGDPVRVGSIWLSAELHTPPEFARRLRPYFEVEHVRGLCTFAPPPALEHLGRIVPGLWPLLSWLDRRFGHVPLMRGLGDHFLLVLRQRSANLFDRQGMGSITASPVIADVNGDGAPEVLVAARGLGLLDRYGRDLYGWPRRIGGPIASTPAIAKVPGNGTVIYVGSDDDR